MFARHREAINKVLKKPPLCEGAYVHWTRNGWPYYGEITKVMKSTNHTWYRCTVHTPSREAGDSHVCLEHEFVGIG